MDFPDVIKGVDFSYCCDNGTPNMEIPIQDIEKFTLHHESGRNGLQLKAHIRKELVDEYHKGWGKHPDADDTGLIKKKYRMSQSSFTIRTKDMPKFSKLLREELMKQKTIIVNTGINAGTPAAQSYQIRKKEMVLQ